ncbi:MAG: penicillin-binding transpeptidase domain-containing protein, partial [Varibaculum cambriense]|nr:penicillin-binding transpeptidase domain-containing protein [Varibaculum cambriense]
VLKAMLREQMITYDQYKEAKAIPVPDLLKVSPGQQGCAAAGKASYFCAYAVNEIYNNPVFGKSLNDRRRLLLRGGLKIYTTMDSNLQNLATDTAFNRIPEGDSSGLSIAISSIEPGTGKIRALAQNTPYGNPDKEHPRATQNSFGVDKAHGGGAGFQPGSSYKPVTLATWFDNGYSAYSVVGGRNHYSARDWKVSGNCPVHAGSWDLKNATGGNNYATSVLEGTQKSLNTTYAGMASNLDLCDIYKMSERLGAVSGDPSQKESLGPSFIIGAASVPPLNMANAFGTIASGGMRCSPVALEKVVDADGKTFKVASGNCKRTVEASVANKTAQVLVSTANSYGGRVNIGRQVMAKTGTTNGPNAAWTLGATPNLATAVWVGYSQGSQRDLVRMRINGAYYGIVWGTTVPAMAFREYMSAAVQYLPAASFPDANIGEGKTISQGRARPTPTQQPSEGPASPSPQTTQITQTFYYQED